MKIKENLSSVFIVLLCLFVSSICVGQSEKKEAESAPFLFDMYQMFLDFEIKSIQKIEYEKTPKSLKGYLDSDKKSIVLDNYDGKSRVKVTCTDWSGKSHEIIKSRCFIDPYVPL